MIGRVLAGGTVAGVIVFAAVVAALWYMRRVAAKHRAAAELERRERERLALERLSITIRADSAPLVDAMNRVAESFRAFGKTFAALPPATRRERDEPDVDVDALRK